MKEQSLRMRLHRVFASIAVVAVVCLTACHLATDGGTRSTGKFERTLKVTGSARLELKNGSGDVTIHAGAAGQVHIRAEVQGREFLFGGENVEDIVNHPPIEQTGNIIRVGDERRRLRNISITYTIEVPGDAEVRAGTGSGNLEVTGVSGAVMVSTGSGDIKAHQLGADAEVSTGSGDVEVREVSGNLRASTGSGDMTLDTIRGEVRVNTGSGQIHITRPGGRVTAKTGSGDLDVKGVSADLRMDTGSGECRVEGNPAANSYWEATTASGDITLNVPDNASFRLHARSNNHIETGIPLTVEEQSKKELRGRVGKGEARVEVSTSSGRVRIR